MEHRSIWCAVAGYFSRPSTAQGRWECEGRVTTGFECDADRAAANLARSVAHRNGRFRIAGRGGGKGVHRIQRAAFRWFLFGSLSTPRTLSVSACATQYVCVAASVCATYAYVHTRTFAPLPASVPGPVQNARTYILLRPRKD